MNSKSKQFLLFFSLAFIFIFQTITPAQNVKRLVVIKVDGLPGYYVDSFVKQRNPTTGKSQLPWFDEIFYKNGTHLDNFYTRGISLSGPSWLMLDTGQHLQIKGNVEFDRFTLQSYNYLDVFAYQFSYGRKKSIDSPGVEVLDQLKIPLLCDVFSFEDRYTSYQLYQRGNGWGVLGMGFLKMFPTNPNDFIDEWGIGLDYRNATINQNEGDIIKKLSGKPNIDYYDYFSGDFDHVSHLNNNKQARFNVLKELDGTLGRIWTAIQKSPRADETAIVVISDHGFNSDDKIYSQGFNLVKLLGSENGGGHHVAIKQILMRDYSVKGLYPFNPYIVTNSNDSSYLKGQSKDYPTALLDSDGNERASLHLRNSDLNILQILLQQLQTGKLDLLSQRAAEDAFFEIVQRHHEDWEKTAKNLTEELDALHRWIETQQQIISKFPPKYTDDEIAKGINEEAIRITVQTANAVQDESKYREYIRVLSNLLALKRDFFYPKDMKTQDFIAIGAMGERNSVYQLQNYVTGLSENGFVLKADDQIDFEKSFKHVNYFELFENQTVQNNVQTALNNHPIDFIAMPISLGSISNVLSPDLKSDEDAIWIYGGSEKQALLFARTDSKGNQSFRYLPIANLSQQSDGKYSFQIKEWDAGFPMKIFEDVNFNVPNSDKTSWLDNWHTEVEWLEATHKTIYSNGVIGLNEQLNDHQLTGFENEQGLSEDEKLIRRFRQNQRRLAETDLLILANSHWNFDVRGFNSGGNHGSFFRVSTNSTLMIAGGAKTKIPRGLTVQEPYDSLSFIPTLLELMGKTNADNAPLPKLYQQGFRKFPGRIIQEVIN